MWDWTNKTYNGIYYSRYIASWRRVGGPYYDETFREWLTSLGMPEDTVWDIYDMATNGKMELEDHARVFMRSKGLKPLAGLRRRQVIGD